LVSSLHKLGWGQFPGITWMTQLMDDLALRSGVQFSSNLLLFRKSLLTLEGVVADLNASDKQAAQTTTDAIIMASFLNHWICELPCRFVTPFDERLPTTHLSTRDLMSVAFAGPTAIARWWGESGRIFGCRRPTAQGRDDDVDVACLPASLSENS